MLALILTLLSCAVIAAAGGFAVGRRRQRAPSTTAMAGPHCGTCGSSLSRAQAGADPHPVPSRSIAGKSHIEVEALLGPPTMELITSQGLQVSYCDGEITVLYVAGTATWFLVPPAPSDPTYRLEESGTFRLSEAGGGGWGHH